MADLAEAIDRITPLTRYESAGQLEADVELLLHATNPNEEEYERATDKTGTLQEPELLSIDDIQDASDERLRRAFDEWDGVKDQMAEMYWQKAKYLEWESRRAHLLDSMSRIASIQFGDEESEIAEMHRITVEVRMWAAFAKHLLLDVEIEDIDDAESSYQLLGLDRKHRINGAIMTSSSIFESVGGQILSRNHSFDSDAHLTMSEINDQLSEEDYLSDGQYEVIDAFRSNIRNSIAHDILERTRFDQFDDFRGEVIRPCWRVVDISEELTDSELEPESGL